jgi:hypothetical protein
MANPFDVVINHLVTMSTTSYVLDRLEEVCVERAQLARKDGDEETARTWDRKGWAIAVAKSEVANEENYRYFCNNEGGEQ